MATLNQGGVEWRKMKGMEPDDIALSFSTVAKKSGCAMLSKKFFNSYIAAEIISCLLYTSDAADE